MASKWSLPIIFWCENNGMVQHSAIEDIFPGKRIAVLAAGYGIPALEVDGQDLFACSEAALSAIQHTRGGNGPIFVECTTLRAQEHSVGGVNYAGNRLRDAATMEDWKKTRNPLTMAARRLIDEEICTENEIQEISAAAQKEAEDIEAYCIQSPKATPPLDELVGAVYAD